jgi:hypothetical protein
MITVLFFHSSIKHRDLDVVICSIILFTIFIASNIHLFHGSVRVYELKLSCRQLCFILERLCYIRVNICRRLGVTIVQPVSNKCLQVTISVKTYRGADISLAQPTTLSTVFAVQGTDGSLKGPDPENRVGHQEIGSPGRPVSSGLQVPGDLFPSWSG